MFLPLTKREMDQRGWEAPDFLCVTGDAYVDHPSFGMAIVSRLLEALGFRVCMIAQPTREEDYLRFGPPRYGWWVNGGNIDSMVAHYTAAKRRRSDDAYTPGGKAGKRPDRATVAYCKKIRALFPDAQIVIGGLEASMRRFAHYDYWADQVLPSILDDAAAKTVRAHLNANGVETLLGDTVVRAEGEDKITSVTLKSGKTLPCDLLVLAVGVRPNTALAESAGAQVNRGITVNHETMETTVPGIFAAGDCVRSYDILDGQEKIIALWPNAVREGATAAYNMAGCEHKDAGSFAVNAIDFFGLRICTCGLIRAEGATVLSREGENSGKRLLIKDNRLVGFVLLNASERAGIYTALIQNRVELNTLSGDLLDEPGLMLYARDIRTEKLTGGVRV